MDRLQAMTLLVAAVDTGSFTAAGRKLRIPLPTVSRRIADLEARLKTQLLIRTTRRLALTEAGAAYVAACRRILERINEAETQAAGQYIVPRGELVLTAPVVFGRLHVLPVIDDFLKRFGEINIHLKLADQNFNLLDEHVDVAVRIGELPDSALVATRVGLLRRVVCGSPTYLAERGMPRAPADLGSHHCVTFASPAGHAPWVFDTRGRSRRAASPTSRLEVNTAEAAIDAAIAGVGLTRVLSYQVASAVADGSLKIVLRDFEPAPIPVHLAHAHSAPLPLKMRKFIDFAAPRLRRSVLAIQKRLGYGADERLTP